MKKTILILTLLFIVTGISYSQIWGPLGSGMNNPVYALTVYNYDLIAGGSFSTAGGFSAKRIAKWNGTTWSPLGTGMSGGYSGQFVFTCAVYNSELIAGGGFLIAGGDSAKNIAKWNGTSWSPLGSGLGNSTSEVRALIVFNNELIAGGDFTTAGGVSAIYIAKWNGTTWLPLGSGMNDYVYALTVYNNELIAGGEFTTAGGVSANRIAKWNGTTWSPLGSGVSGISPVSFKAVTVYNNELIAGGYFTIAGGDSAKHIAKWNGTSWSPLGSGLGSGMNVDVNTLQVYNNELIAGGFFSTAGGITANKIAKWNGISWSPLGSGMNSTVNSLTVYNNELIAGGEFTTTGGVSANRIAKWGTATGIKEIQEIPSDFKLYQNYPNPFNSMTKIQFQVPMDSRLRGNDNVVLIVFDLLGREVKTLVNEFLNAGIYEIQFDASGLSSGTYFYKLETDEFKDIKKLVLIK